MLKILSTFYTYGHSVTESDRKFYFRIVNIHSEKYIDISIHEDFAYFDSVKFSDFKKMIRQFDIEMEQ